MNQDMRDLIAKGGSLLDGIGTNSNLSGRQKAGQMLDVGANLARLGIDPGISERLSGMQSALGANRLAKTQAAAFGQEASAAGARRPVTEQENASPLATMPAAAGDARGKGLRNLDAAIAAPPTLGGAPLARTELGGVLAPAPSGGPLADSARAGGFRPESSGLTVQPGQAGGTVTFNDGRRAGQTLEIDQPRYTAPDGTPTSTHRGSQENLQGIADAEGIKKQLANIQRMRLETDAFDPTITDPHVRESARQQLQHLDAQAGREGEAYSRMLDNQGKLAKLQVDGQMASLQSQFLAENDPARREAIAEKIRGVSGKAGAAPVNLQHIETDRGTMVFDPRTGRMMPAVGPDGQPVAGGKALTEFQGKATGFGMRAAESSRIIDEIGQGGKIQPSLLKRAAEAVPLIGEGLGMAANHLQTPEQQQIEQAQRDFINAVLRQESGAVISDAEFANARKQYFPVLGDSPQVVAQKQANREAAINGFRISAGPGARNIGVPPQAAPPAQQPQAQKLQPAAAPKAGAVEDGYVFLGGNPNDPSNWAEVRK